MLKLATDVIGQGSTLRATSAGLNLTDWALIRGLLTTLEGTVNWFKAAETIAKVDGHIAEILPSWTHERAAQTPLRLADMSEEQAAAAVDELGRQVCRQAGAAGITIVRDETD